MRILFFLTCLISQTTLAQEFFKLKGEVSKPSEDKIILTLYRDWVSIPEDYTLFLDADNRFAFEVELSDLAYLDINYGLNGMLFQIIEPKDDLYLKFDGTNFYETFHPTGSGSAKWVYYLNHQNKFEKEKDTERGIHELLKGSYEEYKAELKILEQEQLELLDKYKRHFSEGFFRLRRADISGKINKYKLAFLNMHPSALSGSIFNEFELKSIGSELQAKSFDYGDFVESLLNQYKRGLKIIQVESISTDYTFLKYAFEKDMISKPIAERLLANKIVFALDLEGYSSEIDALVRDYEVFAQNAAFKNYVQNKQKIAKGIALGGPAPDFVLTSGEGNFVSLKDFRGENLLLVIWASWCEPCLKDLTFLPIIENYFKSAKTLKILNVAVDTPEDYLSVKSQGLAAGQSLRVDPNGTFSKGYGIQSVPFYVLLDKEGNWLEDKLIEPALDEGRGLIKQLEDIFSTH
ncbi:MAG: thiol-disulfide isomerase/thioredoxin [Arcticibacterium sp.]|jgi:thiol-disulfide isomerase/thioredoxin